jgi:hypothetical protein
MPLSVSVGAGSFIDDFVHSENRVSWSRLYEQLFRVDKWSVCRG